MTTDSTRKLGHSPRVHLTVTPEIIAAATKGDSSHCMIADTIAAQIPDARNISVDLQTIRWSNRKRGERYIYLTPPAGQDALVRFDQGHPVDEFSLKLSRGQVTRIKASTKDAVEQRDQRVAAIAAKEAAGEPLTTSEKRAKAHLQQTERPTNHGSAELVAEDGVPVRRGGEAPPTAVLSNSKGRVRQFGMKTLRRADGGPLTIGLQVID